MKKIVLSFVLALISIGSYSQMLLTDNFSVTTNDSLTAIGWVSFSGGTTNAIRATGSPLTYSGYPGSGVGYSASITNNGQDIYKDMLNTNTSSGNVYTSFLANITAAQATGDYFFGYLPNNSTTLYSGRVFAKLTSTGYYRVAVNKSSEVAVYSNDSFALNSTNLFVVRYAFNSVSSTDDSVYLYVFTGGVPTSQPANPTAFCYNATATDLLTVGRIAIRQGTSTSAPSLLMSGVRVATIWGNAPLPVKLTDFAAKSKDNSVFIYWATSSETNNSHFDVEKSVNGKDFESIGKVKGSANSNQTLKYSFVDNKLNKTAYYRLKQVDFNGNYEFSKVITPSQSKDFKKEIKLSVLPNPFTNEIFIADENNNNEVTSVEIADITGKVKYASRGSGEIRINTSEFANGVYFIRVSQGDISTIKRIIKN